MGLERKSRKIFGFKGLIGKIFRNKDLAPRIQRKKVLEQFRWPFWERHTSGCSNQIVIIVDGEVDACDGRHRLDVMKKSQN
jgi:hypothetical protein